MTHCAPVIAARYACASVYVAVNAIGAPAACSARPACMPSAVIGSLSTTPAVSGGATRSQLESTEQRVVEVFALEGLHGADDAEDDVDQRRRAHHRPQHEEAEERGEIRWRWAGRVGVQRPGGAEHSREEERVADDEDHHRQHPESEVEEERLLRLA